MRPRLHATALWQCEAYANRTHRNVSDALEILVNAGFRALSGTAPTAPAVSIDPTNDDDASPSGRTMALHTCKRMVQVVENLAETERRSISFTLKALVREGLERRGLWRQAKVPLLSQPANAAPAVDVQPA